MKPATGNADSTPDASDDEASEVSFEEKSPTPNLRVDLSAALPERSSPELRRFYLTGERPSDRKLSAAAAPLAAWAFTRDADPAGDADAPGFTVAALRYAEALSSARAEAVSELTKAVGDALGELRGLVVADEQHTSAAQGEKALSAALEGPSGGHIDIAGLAKLLPGDRGPKRLDEAQRSRMLELCEALEKAKVQLEDARVHVLVGGDVLPEALDDEIRVERCDDPHGAACARLDELEAAHIDLARTLRMARLEHDQAYRPELHDVLMATLDLDSLSDVERLALPPVLLVDTMSRAIPLLPSLLAERRPLHVLLREDLLGDGLSRSVFESRLASMAKAFERSYVASFDTRTPERLEDELDRMARQTGPALAVLAEAPPDVDRDLYHWLAGATGTHLPFVYDPSVQPATEQWRQPAGSALSPKGTEVNVPCLTPTGQEVELGFTLSPADLICLDPTCEGRRLDLSPEEWAADQLPLDAFLAALSSGESRGELPFVWGVSDDGDVVRVLVNRAAAELARERRRAGRALAELSGLDDPWANAAAERTREELETSFAGERGETEERHAREIAEAKKQAASDAFVRFVDVLANLSPEKVNAMLRGAAAPAKTAPIPAALATPPANALPPAPAPVATPAAAPTPASAEPSAPTPEPASSASDDDLDPYLDSSRCTTCNECTNAFPAIFAYNADKQAELVATGPIPFASLVVAAEKCPALCISPGSPRPDDSTVTPALITRAQKFS